MTDSSTPAARPVSLITIFFILALFAAFYFVARRWYVPASLGPQNAAAENLNEDAKWKATNANRRTALQELQEFQAREATTYGWIDQQAGVVRLPIERAMDLTAEKYGGRR